VRPRTTIVALVLTAAAAGCASAGAAEVVTPPPNTPNLALMVIQPSDLAPGAVIAGQAYVSPPRDFTAAYDSAMTSTTTSNGTEYAALEDFVALAPDATTANSYFGSEQSLFDSRAGHKTLVRRFMKQFPKRERVTKKDFSFSASGTAGVGSSSLVETITFDIKHQRFQEVIIVFNVGAVDVIQVLSGELNQQVAQTDAVALANTVDTHINTVLGTTGATGTTGTT
jgi:hypothetical protein